MNKTDYFLLLMLLPFQYRMLFWKEHRVFEILFP